MNGYVRIPCSTIFKGKCSFACRPGFFVNGSKIFSCSANSKWEPTPGQCNGKDKACKIVILKVSHNKKHKSTIVLRVQICFFSPVSSSYSTSGKEDPFIEVFFFQVNQESNETVYESEHTQFNFFIKM